MTFGTILVAMLVQISPSSIPSKPLVTSDGQKVVCKLSSDAGSRIPSRVCRTKAQWERIEREMEEDIRSAYGNANGRSGTIVNDAEGRISSPRP